MSSYEGILARDINVLRVLTHPGCVRRYSELKAAADIADSQQDESPVLVAPLEAAASLMIATSRTSHSRNLSIEVGAFDSTDAPCRTGDPGCVGCPFHTNGTATEHALAVRYTE